MTRLIKFSIAGLLTLSLFLAQSNLIFAKSIKSGFEVWKASSVMNSGTSVVVKTTKYVDKSMVKSSKLYVADQDNRLMNVKASPEADGKTYKITPEKVLVSKEYRLYIPNAYKVKGKAKSVVILFVVKKQSASTVTSSKYVKNIQVKYTKMVTNVTVKTTKEVFSLQAIFAGKKYNSHYEGGLTYRVAMAKVAKGSKIVIHLYDSHNKLIGSKEVSI